MIWYIVLIMFWRIFLFHWDDRSENRALLEHSIPSPLGGAEVMVTSWWFEIQESTATQLTTGLSFSCFFTLALSHRSSTSQPFPAFGRFNKASEFDWQRLQQPGFFQSSPVLALLTFYSSRTPWLSTGLFGRIRVRWAISGSPWWPPLLTTSHSHTWVQAFRSRSCFTPWTVCLLYHFMLSFLFHA